MQSLPVSPPPITTTCVRLLRNAAVLLRQEIHREMDAVEVAAGDRQVARGFRAAGQCQRVILVQHLARVEVAADMDAVMEGDALGFHLRHAAIDDGLLHLEIGNAISQEPAGLGVFLVDMHLVTGARELLRAGHARRAGADHRDTLAGLELGDFRLDPATLPGTVDDRAFDGLDGDRVVVDVERAGGFARRRTYAARKLREIIGRVQVA
jgi:hypothetical protein